MVRGPGTSRCRPSHGRPGSPGDVPGPRCPVRSFALAWNLKVDFMVRPRDHTALGARRPAAPTAWPSQFRRLTGFIIPLSVFHDFSPFSRFPRQAATRRVPVEGCVLSGASLGPPRRTSQTPGSREWHKNGAPGHRPCDIVRLRKPLPHTGCPLAWPRQSRARKQAVSPIAPNLAVMYWTAGGHGLRGTVPSGQRRQTNTHTGKRSEA